MFKGNIKNYNLDLFVPNLMADLIGFLSIGLVLLITLFIAIRWKGISQIIYVAFYARVILMLIGHYIFHLPDSTNDALGFSSILLKQSSKKFFSL